MDKQIEAFFTSAAYAVVGASADRSKYGNKVLRCYIQKNKKVYPVNPKEKTVEGLACTATLSELPAEVKSISIITPPAVTEKIVEQAIQKGIKNIWMQPGAESALAIKTAEQQGLNVIAGQKYGISLNTVNAVMDMLLAMNAQDSESSKDPRAAFLEFKDTLTREEQNKLDQYVIVIPYLSNPSEYPSAFVCNEASLAFFRPTSLKNEKSRPYQERMMTFAEAMVGGSQSSPCRRTFEIFNWQFVLSFNPRALERIPERVKKMARADHYLLGATPEKPDSKQNKFALSFSSITEIEEGEENTDIENSAGVFSASL